MAGTCHYCGPTDRELRPYGPGGATVCNPCVKATPQRTEIAKRAYFAALDRAAAAGTGLIEIGHEDGPRPGRLTDG